MDTSSILNQDISNNIPIEKKPSLHNSLNKKQKAVSTDSFLSEQQRMTLEFSEIFFKETGKQIEITLYSSLRDEIVNYRKLSDLQLANLINLTEEEKIEIIKLYNKMFSNLQDIFTF